MELDTVELSSETENNRGRKGMRREEGDVLDDGVTYAGVSASSKELNHSLEKRAFSSIREMRVIGIVLKNMEHFKNMFAIVKYI